MGNSFVTWLVGAAIVGLALFLLLGNAESPVESVAATSDAVPVAETASYWQATSAGGMTIAPASVKPTEPIAGSTASCSSCSATSPSAAPSTPPTLATSATSRLTAAGSYGVVLSASAPCNACGAVTPQPSSCSTAVCGGAVPMVGGCGVTLGPCAEMPCGQVTCAADPCGERPQINRNGPLCVAECSFIQLRASVPLPVCRGVRFEWSATRGSFLDPTAPEPLYFAPATGLPDGEDVWVTLTVIDASGARTTDQVKLHVLNVR